jgi:hypothetical protein
MFLSTHLDIYGGCCDSAEEYEKINEKDPGFITQHKQNKKCLKLDLNLK